MFTNRLWIIRIRVGKDKRKPRVWSDFGQNRLKFNHELGYFSVRGCRRRGWGVVTVAGTSSSCRDRHWVSMATTNWSGRMIRLVKSRHRVRKRFESDSKRFACILFRSRFLHFASQIAWRGRFHNSLKNHSGAYVIFGQSIASRTTFLGQVFKPIGWSSWYKNYQIISRLSLKTNKRTIYLECPLPRNPVNSDWNDQCGTAHFPYCRDLTVLWQVAIYWSAVGLSLLRPLFAVDL